MKITHSTKGSTAPPTAFVLPFFHGENGASVNTFWECGEFLGGALMWWQDLTLEFWVFRSGMKWVSQSEFEGFCVNSFLPKSDLKGVCSK